MLVRPKITQSSLSPWCFRKSYKYSLRILQYKGGRLLFKKVNLLVDINSYLDKSKKELYLDLINSNLEFIKTNKVSKEIEENINFFKNKINNL